MGTITALFTAIYSFRLVYLVFLNTNNSYKFAIKNAHDLPILMFIPLFVLSFGSIFIGYLTKDLFIGLGSNFLTDSIFILPQNLISMDAEFIPYTVKGLPSALSLIGIIIALFLYKYLEFFLVFFRYINIINTFYKFLVNKWYFDFIQNELIGKPILVVAYLVFFKLIDKGFLELLGPTGISLCIYKLSFGLKKAQTGYIYQYSLVLLFWFILIFVFLDFIYF